MQVFGLIKLAFLLLFIFLFFIEKHTRPLSSSRAALVCRLAYVCYVLLKLLSEFFLVRPRENIPREVGHLWCSYECDVIFAFFILLTVVYCEVTAYEIDYLSHNCFDEVIICLRRLIVCLSVLCTILFLCDQIWNESIFFKLVLQIESQFLVQMEHHFRFHLI